MPPPRRPILRRKRVLIPALLAGTVVGVWVFGRHALVHWAVARSLAANGLAPATFRVESVGLASVAITDLELGAAPWLRLGRADVSFTLAQLLSSRVSSVKLNKLAWTIRVTKGEIDWGFPSNPSSQSHSSSPDSPNPLRKAIAAAGLLDLPADSLDLTDATIRIETDGVPRELPLSIQLVRSASGRFAADIAVTGFDLALDSHIDISSQGRLRLDAKGTLTHASPASPAGSPASSASTATSTASWSATFAAAEAGTGVGGGQPATLNLNADIPALAETAGGLPITIQGGKLFLTSADADSRFIDLHGSFEAHSAQIGTTNLHALSLRAVRAGTGVDLVLSTSGDGWSAPELQISLRAESATQGSTPPSTLYTAQVTPAAPLTFDLAAQGLSGSVPTLNIKALADSDSTGFHFRSGKAQVSGVAAKASAIALSDLHADASFTDFETIHIETLAGNLVGKSVQAAESAERAGSAGVAVSGGAVAEGGEIAAAPGVEPVGSFQLKPFAWSRTQQNLHASLAFESIALAHWLPFLSKDRIIGEGVIAGTASLGLDWSSGTPVPLDARATVVGQDLRVGPVALRTLSATATQVPSGVDLTLVAAGEGWDAPGLDAAIRWESPAPPNPADPKSIRYSAAAHATQPLAFDLSEHAFTGTLASLALDLQALSDAQGFRILSGNLRSSGGAAQAGDIELADAHLEATLTDAHTVSVTALGTTFGDGGSVTAAPFVCSLDERSARADLKLENLRLAYWLPIVSGQHATGEGRVGGELAVGLDWSTGAPQLSELRGSIAADPPRGYIQAKDADSLGDLLEAQDPRFATDPVMQPVKEKIIAALQDFAFSKLTLQLSREADHTVAQTYLSGFGRHGDDPQGLNLTLDMHVQDSFVNLAPILSAKSRLKEAARDALKDFFDDRSAPESTTPITPATPEEKP